MSGLELLANFRRQNSQTPVIMMTAFGSMETAVEAMKAGAADFLLKPFSLDHLMPVVYKALEMRALREENRELRAELASATNSTTSSGAAQHAGDFRHD